MGKQRLSILDGSLLLGVLAGSGLIIEYLLVQQDAGAVAVVVPAAALYGLGCFLLSLLLASRAAFRHLLTSRQFAGLLLAATAAIAVLATLVSQSTPSVCRGFGLAAVWGVAGACLLLVAVRRRPRTVRQWAAVCAHVGLLGVLGGAVVGILFGAKGHLWLREGEEAATFQPVVAARLANVDVPLGFRVRLDDFRLVSYAPRIRLQFFEVGTAGIRLLASGDPALLGEGTRTTIVPGIRIQESALGPTVPAASRVRLAIAGESEPLELSVGQILWVDPRHFLTLRQLDDPPRDFYSTLTVTAQDHSPRTTTIEVNHPLRYGGVRLYQMSYDPRDLTRSGLLVVRDPGIPAVYAGLALCLLGVVLFCARPVSGHPEGVDG